MQAASDRMFRSDCAESASWFDQSLYDSLVLAKGHEGDHKTFLVSHDQDCRHSYFLHTTDNQFLQHGGLTGRVDRRLLPERTDMHIPLKPVVDYVPIAQRVPDCVQSPIEMFFATVKGRFSELMNEHRVRSVGRGEACAPETVVKLALRAFEEKGTAVLAKSCWKHAVKALLVWTTPTHLWVVIDGHSYLGTGGNWVHKLLGG